jgi:branched-chain amino acid transport system permease protein
MALGLSLIYGIVKVVNFAHGEMITFGMLFLCLVEMNFSVPLCQSFIILLLLYFLFFTFFQYGILKKLMGVNETTQFIGMAAIAMIMLNMNLMIFKADTYCLQAFNSLGSIDLGTFKIQKTRVIAACLSCLSTAILFLFLNKTLVGKGIKAISLNRKKALYMGLPFTPLLTFCFIILSVLMATSALSLTLIMNVSVHSAPEITLLCFIIVILGGLGHIHGTLLAGILIGYMETFITFYGTSLYKGLASFVLLILILIIKPQGLFNKKHA